MRVGPSSWEGAVNASDSFGVKKRDDGATIMCFGEEACSSSDLVSDVGTGDVVTGAIIVGSGGKLISKLPNTSKLKQTGGGGYTASADDLYDAIRSSNTDVAAIAKNTGIKPSNIQKVKDHVFYNEHDLDRYVDYGFPVERKRFDSDLDQALAWKRLEEGNHTKDDITWLKHETAEAWYEKKHNAGYSESHNAAEKRWTGAPWRKE